MKQIIALVLCLLLIVGLAATQVHAMDLLIPSPEFRSLAEYENYLSKDIVPSDFIHVSKLALFGEFKYCNVFYYYNPTKYRYELNTGITITIDHNITGVADNMTHHFTVSTDSANLLRLSNTNEDSFCYFRKGLYYIYSAGKLNTIAWFASGILFQIKITAKDLESYASIPVLMGLLSVSEEEADAAIAEICKSIGVRLQKTHFQIRSNRIQRIVQAVYIIPLPAFLIIRWIINKRRRAKGIVTRSRRSLQRDELPVSTLISHESPFDTPNSH